MGPPFFGTLLNGPPPPRVKPWESYPGEGTTDETFVPRAPLPPEKVAELYERFPRQRLYLDIDDERRRVENTLRKDGDVAPLKTMDAAIAHFPRAFMIASNDEAVLCGEGENGEITLLMRWGLGNVYSLVPPEQLLFGRSFFGSMPEGWAMFVGPIVSGALVGYFTSVTAGLAFCLAGVLAVVVKRAVVELANTLGKNDR